MVGPKNHSPSPVQTYVDCLAPLPLKCALVGDSGVGKSALLASYTTEKFKSEHSPTIYDKFTISLAVYGKKINLTLCDTSGLDDFGHLRPLCYPQLDIGLICFSVTDRNSFDNACNKWVKELRKHCPGLPIILVGTNIDRRDNGTLLRDYRTSSKRYVSKTEGLKAASNMKAITYTECSSKTRVNVKTVFDEVVANALEMSATSSSHTPNKQCVIL
jgi:small GTP-binding protein